MFHYTVETKKSVEDAVESLEQQLSLEQFGVLWKFNVKDKLTKKGLDFHQEFRILEVCNPKEAESILSENTLAGYFLPCKMVVYDEQGTTKIGMPKPTALVSLIGDAAVQSLASDIEERLIHCISKSV